MVMRVIVLPGILLPLLAGTPGSLGAQRMSPRAAIMRTSASPNAQVARIRPVRNAAFGVVALEKPALRRRDYALRGAIAGGVILGSVVAIDASSCGDCMFVGPSIAAGVVVGAGVGALAGVVFYSIRH